MVRQQLLKRLPHTVLPGSRGVKEGQRGRSGQGRKRGGITWAAERGRG